MPKNLTISGAREEELMEAQAFYSNFIEELDKISELIESNERLDIQNDRTRAEAINFLLKALESYSARAYEDVDRCLHAAIQKLHSQELIDLKDNEPRNEAKIKLAVARQKALHNQESIARLIDRCQRKKK